MNPFKVVKAVKTGYKAYKASKYVKKAATAKKTTKAASKAISKPKVTTVSKNTVRVANKPKAVTQSTKVAKTQAKKISALLNSKSKNVSAPYISSSNATGRKVLNSFKGGQATLATYKGGTELYRVGGKKGGFWSPEPPPATEYQWRVNYAIKQGFRNNASTLYTIRIPEGSSVSGWEGMVGSQGMGLYGGARQIYIDYLQVPSEWITKTKMIWE